MGIFQIFCIISSIVGIISNALIVILSIIKSDNSNKDVHSTFAHICCSAIIIAIAIVFTMPEEIRSESSLIKIPHGILSKSSASILSAVTGLQIGCYIYILLNLSILFLNRFNVMCNKNNMSTLFSERNMKIFTGFAITISIIQMVFVYTSTAQTDILWERLNRTTNIVDDLYEKQELSATYLKNQQIQLNNQKQIESDIVVKNGVHNNISSNGKDQNRGQIEATRSRINVYGSDYNVNPMVWGSEGLFLLIFIASYVTIIISSVFIRKSLKTQQSDMSDKMKERQKGMYTSLIFYSILPCVITLITYINFFQGMITGSFLIIYQGYLTTIMTSLIPPLLGIFVFIFVKFYRQSFAQIILRKKKKEVKTEALPEIDSSEGKQRLTTSQMKGMLNQGLEDSVVTMPQ
ncbi:7TM GPCR, serpentine receptor class r (Str) family-containing protein [Strongyloides ratti]|uniref:7TM GPCR, serpentine receptor class r (Str) family-containing protein n=1 Tax=Strongyloides ratti TaxID=34506 RepID=A0A090MUQ8_STRRB|nr:7TM GPCR, serpentine receptor class r (Str) family-containing protein [Strongyloides ratti]CEF62373.1 7TM GPCR, serpentine receptor class r (Str) family-containing protein [Strongyloides ratti]